MSSRPRPAVMVGPVQQIRQDTWMVRTLQFRAFVTRMVGAVLVRAMRQEHVDRLTACLRGPWTASGGA